jgi:hypothetical protein
VRKNEKEVTNDPPSTHPIMKQGNVILEKIEPDLNQQSNRLHLQYL